MKTFTEEDKSTMEVTIGNTIKNANLKYVGGKQTAASSIRGDSSSVRGGSSSLRVSKSVTFCD